MRADNRRELVIRIIKAATSVTAFIKHKQSIFLLKRI